MKFKKIITFLFILTLIFLSIPTASLAAEHPYILVKEEIIDYSQGILPPSPSFLPLFAKEFTMLRQRIYQYIKSPTD